MQNYRIITQNIGSGAYSIVHKALHLSTGQIVAIKIISQEHLNVQHIIKRQIMLLKQCQHQNIIKLKNNFVEGKLTYLVFEYLPMDLITYYKTVQNQKKRNLTQEQIEYIAWQLTNALKYLHNDKGIMHRDIKPQNVLIQPRTLKAKLIDFGFAKYLKNRNTKFYQNNTQYMVTRWYRPLQVVLGLPYDQKIDVFSLGAMLIQLYLGHQIFRSTSNIDQFYWIVNVCGFPQNWLLGRQALQKMNLSLSPQKIRSNSLPQLTLKLKDLTKNLRLQTRNLLLQMLKTSPHERISITQILNHQYFDSFRIGRKNKMNYTCSYIKFNNKFKNHKILFHEKEQQKQLNTHNINFKQQESILNNRNRAYSMDQLNLTNKLMPLSMMLNKQKIKKVENQNKKDLQNNNFINQNKSIIQGLNITNSFYNFNNNKKNRINLNELNLANIHNFSFNYNKDQQGKSQRIDTEKSQDISIINNPIYNVYKSQYNREKSTNFLSKQKQSEIIQNNNSKIDQMKYFQVTSNNINNTNNLRSNRIRSLNQGIKVISSKNLRVFRLLNNGNNNSITSKQRNNKVITNNISPKIGQNFNSKVNNGLIHTNINNLTQKVQQNNIKISKNEQISTLLNKPMFLRIKQKINDGKFHQRGDKNQKQIKLITNQQLKEQIIDNINYKKQLYQGQNPLNPIIKLRPKRNINISSDVNNNNQLSSNNESRTELKFNKNIIPIVQKLYLKDLDNKKQLYEQLPSTAASFSYYNGKINK